MTVAREPGAAAPAGLFSIDVDAELAKICSRSHGSPHHYPVELVRAALARGARRVVLRSSGHRLSIADDGAPIDEPTLAALALLFDAGAASETRQQALYRLEQVVDGALLALLAARPAAIELRSGDGQSGRRLVWRRGRCRLEPLARPERGTAIAIARRGDAGQERAVLRDYCRFAEAEVVVDGAVVSGDRGGRDALLTTSLAGWATVRRFELELPACGELCRVFRLEHGVVKQRWAGESAPRLVYQAVVECPGALPADFVERTLAATRDLYGEVAGRYPQLRADQRDRVDELFFRHYRADRRSPLIDRLAPFRLLGAEQRWTLAQLRQRAGQGLCALAAGEDQARYDLEGIAVVELTPRQQDFLEHDAGIALPAPLLKPARPGRWRAVLSGLRGRLRQAWRALQFRFGRGQARAPDAAGQRLVEALQQVLASGRFVLPRVASRSQVEVVWRERRGGAPCAVVAAGDRAMVLVNGRHRLVRQATVAFRDDPDNLSFILPALLDGHDGWRG